MSEQSNKLLIPPSDINAERGLLGSILVNSKILEDIGDILSPVHFYDKRHETIFTLMTDLWAHGKPIDIVHVLDAMKTKTGFTDEEKGEITKEFLLEVISYGSLISTPIKAATLIKNNYVLRSVANIADDIKRTVMGGEATVEEVLDYAQKKVFEISEENIQKNFINISTSLANVYERISNASDSDETTGIPTGLTDLDAILGGFHKSDLIILAARPSMGKTSLSLEIIKRMAIQNNTPVAVFSLEMSADQLTDKLLSSTSGLDLYKIRQGKLGNDSQDEYAMLGDAIGKLDEAEIWIDDSGHLNINELRTKARRLKSRYNIGVLVIDYLQLMSGNSGTNYGVNRVQEVSDISRNLKMLAKELDIPILALSQLSRNVESRDDKRPMLSDLRDSGSIEQDADVVLFVHRESMYNKTEANAGKANILVSKHRNGETGTVELAWIGKLATFGNLQGGRVSGRVEK